MRLQQRKAQIGFNKRRKTRHARKNVSSVPICDYVSLMLRVLYVSLLLRSHLLMQIAPSFFSRSSETRSKKFNLFLNITDVVFFSLLRAPYITNRIDVKIDYV